jgi:hypothetical protein
LHDCIVFTNCLKRYDCDWCKEYEEYAPIDKSIKSPKQIEQGEIRKKERKIKKVGDASKRGRSNRRNGRKAEREVESMLKDMGLDASRTPMSGALKANGLLPFLKDKLSGDIRIHIDDNELIVECKRNIHSDAWYKLLDEGVIHISGFCYGLRKELFEYLVNGVLPDECIEVEDKRFKKLHSYFNQDDSNIVVVTRPYREPLFFIREDTFKLLRGKFNVSSER